jgi:hypothetical protein
MNSLTPTASKKLVKSLKGFRFCNLVDQVGLPLLGVGEPDTYWYGYYYWWNRVKIPALFAPAVLWESLLALWSFYISRSHQRRTVALGKQGEKGPYMMSFQQLG